MRWRRLLEPTRPVDRRRRRASGTTTSMTTSMTTSATPSPATTAPTVARRAPGRNRPARGARSPKSVQPPRRRQRRINWTRVTALAMCLVMVGSLAWLAGGP